MMDELSGVSKHAIENDLVGVQHDVKLLKALVYEYMRCIKDQDKTAFQKLFYNEKTPYLGKFDEASEVIACGNNPDVVNDLGVFDISKQTFINSMVAPPPALKFEETFDDLHVDTDGLVASVSFDYNMLVNGNKIKSGREFWQLINSNDSWRIVSVIHSIKF